MTIYFQPATVGTVQGALTFTDADMPNALKVKLSGQGLRGPTATPTGTATPTASATQTATATLTPTSQRYLATR